jgi:SAM-dependent methyltransferase
VIWSVPNKASAFRECARILKPGARFVFSAYDWELSPPGYPPPVTDHRPLLAAAGFEVEAYDVQPDAERLRGRYWAGIVAAEQILLREAGEEQTRRLMTTGRAVLGLLDGVDYLSRSQRVFVVARKRSSTTTGPDRPVGALV